MALPVLTMVGPDRPGLVSSLSKALAGQFAGILLVSVPDVQVDALTAGLEALEEGHFRLTVQRADPEATPQAHTIQLDLIGHDRPGIIRDITGVLAERLGDEMMANIAVTAAATGASSLS